MTTLKQETTPPKILLFSVTRNDFEWQYFRSGGKGGQNQNKVNSGCRCIHRDSGARGEARDSRDQLSNRRNAFIRCIETPIFKAWHKKAIAICLGTPKPRTVEDIMKEIDLLMAPKNLKVEYFDPKTGEVQHDEDTNPSLLQM